MSNSVTVIDGVVWTRRSITFNRNSPSPTEPAGPKTLADQPADDAPPPHAHGRRSRGERLAEQPADDEPEIEWDEVYEGRSFERRVRTL